MKGRKHTTITIPKPLFEKIRKDIEGTGFGSVSDYVTFILRQDEKDIKKRLKDLGYLG